MCVNSKRAQNRDSRFNSAANNRDSIVRVTLISELICFLKQENHAIAKMTARGAQYMSALKIACKHKSSRRLRKNLHITILSLFGGEIIFEVFQQM